MVERLASELLSNPLIEAYAVEALGDGDAGAANGDAAAGAASAEVGA